MTINKTRLEKLEKAAADSPQARHEAIRYLRECIAVLEAKPDSEPALPPIPPLVAAAWSHSDTGRRLLAAAERYHADQARVEIKTDYQALRARLQASRAARPPDGPHGV